MYACPYLKHHKYTDLNNKKKLFQNIFSNKIRIFHSFKYHRDYICRIPKDLFQLYFEGEASSVLTLVCKWSRHLRYKSQGAGEWWSCSHGHLVDLCVLQKEEECGAPTFQSQLYCCQKRNQLLNTPSMKAQNSISVASPSLYLIFEVVLLKMCFPQRAHIAKCDLQFYFSLQTVVTVT